MTIAVLANGFNRTSVLGLQSSRETRCVRVRRVDQPSLDCRANTAGRIVGPAISFRRRYGHRAAA
jgi:hypothetical protein